MNKHCSFFLLASAVIFTCTLSLAETGEKADARGRTVLLKKKPMRIASGTVASDELLWLILKEAGAGERLVAVSTLSDSSKYSHLDKVSQDIKGRVGGSLEQLLAVRPDVVILANFNRPELVSKTESLGIPVWVMPGFTSLTDISKAILSLGALIKEEEASGKVNQSFLRETENLRHSPKNRPTVLGLNQDKSAWGPETLFDELVTLAGGQNCLKDPALKGWPRLSSEFLAQLNPDFIVMSGNEAERSDILKQLRSWPELKSWRALKNQKLILIPGRDLHAASPFLLEAGKLLKKHLAGS